MKKGLTIANKKRFYTACIVTILIFTFICGKFQIIKKLNNKIFKSQVVLTSSGKGDIQFEENKYFRRYIIECNKDIYKLKWNESKEDISITLNETDINRLNLSKESFSKSEDISYEKKGDNLIISIRKNYDKNNLVYIDKSNKKRILVLISKVQKPINYKIVVDAGHGGKDNGTSYANINEKDLALKIAFLTENELIFRGCKVVLTRDEDKLLPLKEISDIANASYPNAFISIHINDNKDSRINGLGTYYYDPDQFQKIERNALAKSIQKEIVKSDKWQNKGVIRQNIAILRNSNIPCALVECGFLSNEKDRDKLKDEEVLKSLAVNISNGVIKYLNAESKVKEYGKNTRIREIFLKKK